MDDMTTHEPVAALREALDRLRTARSQQVSDVRLDAYHRDVQMRLEAVIRQTRPRSVRTFRH